MTKPQVTRTYGPIHFEDLEPHRFEDLVRQLIYDFKSWRLLEPTGRLGSDDGYDARGIEAVQDQSGEVKDDDDNEDVDIEISSSIDRLWQIQCKREKAISSKKIEKYVDEIIPKGSDIPYGVIFAAPCDFSKKTRDTFTKKMQEKKVQEFYLWGKADLEDMLVLPKNDNLLYGYFGISLIIRKRALKTQIRSVLATKRKTVRHLGPIDQDSFVPVLIRDASDEHYPYMGAIKDFNEQPRWRVVTFLGHTHDGIRILNKRFIAYRKIDDQTGKLLAWDYSEEVNLATSHEDVWSKTKDYDEKFRRAHSFLDTMEEKNRAFFEIEGIIPYDRIIEIDPLGDTITPHTPHIFVEMKNNFFFEYGEANLVPRGGYGPINSIVSKPDKRRIEFFPKKLPKKPKPSPLPPMGSRTKKSRNGSEEEFEGLKERVEKDLKS